MRSTFIHLNTEIILINGKINFTKILKSLKKQTEQLLRCGGCVRLIAAYDNYDRNISDDLKIVVCSFPAITPSSPGFLYGAQWQ